MISAVTDLYPHVDVEIKYSKKFSDFNANVRKTGNILRFHLSHEWKDISEDIQKGLLQYLATKMFKEKKSTMYIDMYHSFIAKLTDFTPVTNVDSFLKESFDRVNEKYFQGTMELPNLEFGQASIRTLGTYNFHTDTVRLSTVLKDDLEALDFVMYHELLHKQEKFEMKGHRTHSHTPKFRELERKFENFEAVEKRLQGLIRKRRFFSWR